MRSEYMRTVLFILLPLTFCVNGFSQGAEKAATRMQIAYFHRHNQPASLIATLKIREQQYVPFEDAEVHFYSLDDTSKILLCKVMTDSKGEAACLLDDDAKIYRDTSGLMMFEAEYHGSATTTSASKTLEARAADLKISFFQEDTAKYISVVANEMRDNGKTVPITELPIAMYIKGTFSLLSIGQEVTDADGRATLAFPVEMPGDTLGVLTIVAKVDEHEEYGTIEAQGVINWAVPVPIPEEPQRGLGDTDAPLWMVYTLIILLSAVWFHYLYVIYLVYKVKKARRSIQYPG
jgi:hypothetical protein